MGFRGLRHPALRARDVRVAAAWSVHLFTASSAPAAVFALRAIHRGEVSTAFWLMAYTLAVDAIDGTLARAVGVRSVLPWVDGSRLDDVVDYATYVIVPALFLIEIPVLPPAAAPWVAALVTVASAYGFAQTQAKTADHFFTGFPSYWNVVVFYAYALRWPPAVNAAIVTALALAVFVPLRYVYPSRTPTLRGLTVGLGLLWGAVLVWVLCHLETAPRALVAASLLYPAYYFALSIALDVRARLS